MSSTIAIDFDGVIHHDVTRFERSDVIPDPPVIGALDFIRQVMDAGFRVFIFTSRANARDYDATADVPEAIAEWLRKHGLEERYIDAIVVTHKKIGAMVYIDDKGFRFDAPDAHHPGVTALVDMQLADEKRASEKRAERQALIQRCCELREMLLKVSPLSSRSIERALSELLAKVALFLQNNS